MKNKPRKPKVMAFETCPCSRDKLQTVVDQSLGEHSSSSLLARQINQQGRGVATGPEPYTVRHTKGSEPKMQSKPVLAGAKSSEPPTPEETPPPPKKPSKKEAVALTG